MYKKGKSKAAAMETSSLSAYMQTVIRLGNISAAAKELGVSQPALSARIKKLEEQLGAAVLDRSKTPLTLTEVGLAYLESQEKIEEIKRDLARKVTALTNLEAGRLVVGGPASFSIAYLPKAVALFTKEHPGIDIEIVSGTVPSLTADVLSGKVDLFITPYDGANSGLAYQKLLTERILLCLPPKSPLAGQLPAKLEEKDFAALSEETFIVLGADQQLGQKMIEVLARHNVNPKKIIHVDQTITSIALTMSGVGVSLAAETILDSLDPASRPKAFLVDEDICTRSLYIATPKSASLAAADAFAGMLRKANP